MTEDRLFHAIGSILILILAGAVAWGYEWAVMIAWSLLEAVSDV